MRYLLKAPVRIKGTVYGFELLIEVRTVGVQYDCLVADETKAKEFCNSPELFKYTPVPGLDAFKLMTLQALLTNKPIKTPNTYKQWDKLFDKLNFILMWPKRNPQGLFVYRLPDELAQALSELDDRHLSEIVQKWSESESFTMWDYDPKPSERLIAGLFEEVATTL